MWQFKTRQREPAARACGRPNAAGVRNDQSSEPLLVVARADETIFLVRRSHPETNYCSIRLLGEESAMIELVAAAGVLFSISIFVAHAFDAYRTR